MAKAGKITLTLKTELTIEVETEADLQMVLRNMPWIKARPHGFTTEHGDAKMIVSGIETLPGSRCDADKSAVIVALECCKTKDAAAKMLGVTRVTLNNLIKKYKIEMSAQLESEV